MTAGRIWVFGEVLFDHYPDNSTVLGGAPFNVAWHLQAFGLRPVFISRVGNDPAGTAVRRAMHDWGMDTAGLQVDPVLPTGSVTVRLVNGEPQYRIDAPSAYDAIGIPEDLSEFGTPRLLYHGTLALRETPPRTALQHLRQAAPPLVFVDVNLRNPFWDRDVVRRWLRDAHWAKLNRDELRLLGGQQIGTRAQGFALMEDCSLDGLVVTRGATGAEGFTAVGGWTDSPPQEPGPIVDTVGAGDAFAAVMILGLISNSDFALTLTRANAFARALCGVCGATLRDRAPYRHFLRQWGMA